MENPRYDAKNRHTAMVPATPLFIALMTVMLHDVREEMGRKLEQCKYHGLDFTEIMYAYDTLLLDTNDKILTE